jgi:endonuclease/exonuclease/phosphatase family metal-dependent hydrolase
MVIIGDLNSNPSFDGNKQRIEKRSFLTVLERLTCIGLCSAYHTTTKETYGKETTATFYFHKNKHKPYHIDYCFIDETRIIEYKVLNTSDKERDFWLKHSDHVPLVLDFH